MMEREYHAFGDVPAVHQIAYRRPVAPYHQRILFATDAIHQGRDDHRVLRIEIVARAVDVGGPHHREGVDTVLHLVSVDLKLRHPFRPARKVHGRVVEVPRLPFFEHLAVRVRAYGAGVDHLLHTVQAAGFEDVRVEHQCGDEVAGEVALRYFRRTFDPGQMEHEIHVAGDFAAKLE